MASAFRLGVAAAVALMAGIAAPGAAQSREPLGGWVLDLRAVSAGLPAAGGWVPPLATGSIVPSRGFGGDGGVHVLLGPGRFRRLSFGVAGVAAQGRATGPSSPTVTTRMVAGAPSLGLNFGHRQGWSYLSLGAGAAQVTSNAPEVVADPGGWGLVIHYGAGARWFVREHLAVSLDLRFWALTPRAASFERGRAAASTRVAVSAGIALR